MKKFIVNLVRYGLIAFLILNSISYLSLHFLNRSTFYKPQFVENGLQHTHYDYIILGSSMGLTTLDTQHIDRLTGLNGVNLSMDDSSLNSHYLMLQHFYQAHKSTQKVILSISPWDVASPTVKVNTNDHRFLSFISRDYIANYFKEQSGSVFNIYTISRYVPFIGFSYFNTELVYPALLSAIQPTYRNRFDAFGNYYYPQTSPKGLQNQKKEIHQLAFNNPSFRKIVDFCNQKGIELLLYQSPLYNMSVTHTDSSIELLNHSQLIQHTPELFYDITHVNEAGRKICSTEMAKYLIQTKK